MTKKTLLMSDLHIGFKYTRAKDILYVLENETFDRLVLIGDIFDIQQMMKRPYWDQHHTAVLKKLLKIAKKKELIYIIGNHDYPLFYLLNYTDKLVGIKLFREFTYTSNNKNILCIHGDQLENISNKLTILGDLFYYTGLKLNKYVNFIRSKFNMKYWSLSKWGKDKIKKFINKAFNMDFQIEKYKKDFNADVLVYGHTHMPYINASTVNTGTFVEIATYVTEQDGIFTLHNLDL